MEKTVTNVEKRISILGCGWLGLPLAKRILEKHSTWIVKGSTTSDARLPILESAGVKPFLIDLNPDVFATETHVIEFFNSDVLIISLPPKLNQRDAGFYPQQLENVIREARKSPVQDIIFISSTSVYPDLNRVVEEEDVVLPEHSASPPIVIAENLAISLRGPQNVTVLRLGGLLAYNRNPGKYVKGQKDMQTGAIPVNYIHRDDAVNVIISLIEKGVVDETFNIVAPLHPTRREIYEDSCARFGWDAPTFAEPAQPVAFKIISNQKWVTTYPDFQFKYPDPLKFYYSETDPGTA